MQKLIAIEIKDGATFAIAMSLFPELKYNTTLDEQFGNFVIFGDDEDQAHKLVSPLNWPHIYAGLENGPQITLKYILEK